MLPTTSCQHDSGSINTPQIRRRWPIPENMPKVTLAGAAAHLRDTTRSDCQVFIVFSAAMQHRRCRRVAEAAVRGQRL